MVPALPSPAGRGPAALAVPVVQWRRAGVWPPAGPGRSVAIPKHGRESGGGSAPGPCAAPGLGCPERTVGQWEQAGPVWGRTAAAGAGAACGAALQGRAVSAGPFVWAAPGTARPGGCVCPGLGHRAAAARRCLGVLILLLLLFHSFHRLSIPPFPWELCQHFSARGWGGHSWGVCAFPSTLQSPLDTGQKGVGVELHVHLEGLEHCPTACALGRAKLSEIKPNCHAGY